jgi:hypothetical protein
MKKVLFFVLVLLAAFGGFFILPDSSSKEIQPIASQGIPVTIDAHHGVVLMAVGDTVRLLAIHDTLDSLLDMASLAEVLDTLSDMGRTRHVPAGSIRFEAQAGGGVVARSTLAGVTDTLHLTPADLQESALLILGDGTEWAVSRLQASPDARSFPTMSAGSALEDLIDPQPENGVCPMTVHVRGRVIILETSLGIAEILEDGGDGTVVTWNSKRRLAVAHTLQAFLDTQGVEDADRYSFFAPDYPLLTNNALRLAHPAKPLPPLAASSSSGAVETRSSAQGACVFSIENADLIYSNYALHLTNSDATIMALSLRGSGCDFCISWEQGCLRIESIGDVDCSEDIRCNDLPDCTF